ncbi:hypothetical protein IAS59_004225 [Cryptococcus gattii]
MTTTPPRSVQTIKASLEQQLDLAMQGGSTKKLQAEKKAKDEIYKIMQDWFDQQPGLKMNPLLDVAGLDPAHDAPWHAIRINTYLFLAYHEIRMATCRVQDTKGL